jgi:nucleotide-binding universal stress UspA family protein
MRIQRIVVGVDGSPEATNAALMGWRWAVTQGLPFDLVYAAPDLRAAAALLQMPHPFAISPVPFPLAGAEPLLAAARERIAAGLRDYLPADALRGLRVMVGWPGAVLAAEPADALIVLGGKHHGAVARHLGGSTAHHVLHARAAPVLIVAKSVWPIRRVLACLDLSPAAAATLAAARDAARVTAARLRVLHAIERVPVPRVMAAFDMEVIAQRDIAGFSALAADLREVDTADRVTRRGRPAAVIAEEAAAWNADLVVMGCHERGPVARLMEGSVTTAVLNRLPASLLIVPPPRAPEQITSPHEATIRKERSFA